MEESSSAAVAAPLLEVRNRTRYHNPTEGRWFLLPVGASDTQVPTATIDHSRDGHEPTRLSAEDDARRLALAWNCHDELLAALVHVRSIIVEAANTGFNWADGDWAERLFASQGPSFDAVAKATQPPASRGEANLNPTLSKAGA